MYSVYYTPYWVDKSELEHYGVKGMKWGIRKRHDQISLLRKNQKVKNKDDSKINVKKLAKAGAIAVAAGLATYGAYKVYDLKVPKMIDVVELVDREVPYGSLRDRIVGSSTKIIKEPEIRRVRNPRRIIP